ncbi:MAG: carbohydrate ABC transporter permease [Caldilineaceae bacterium SB0665_bin_21]|nr:carbohydrate ABC transporter permease [Caldilineaceae bacterium SB0665_bin_21]MYC63599.1 carbohydrate ABC transporter permease [Caldilineaceae bacterium SB0661_bin_34]
MATDTRVQPAPAVAAAQPRPLRRRSGLMAVFRHVILLPGVVFFVIPLVFMVSTSLKALRQIALFPPELIPNPVLWANYPEVFHYAPMHLYFVNTLFLVLPAIFGAVFTSSLAAYAFARLRAPGKNAIFIVLLSTMMVPAFVTMIPTYILFAKLRWVGGFKPLVIPYLMGSAFFVFLLRQFFLTIPRELEDAAFIDGSSRLRTFTGIVLPLAKPVLATVTIFAFMASWNEYMGPLIYLSNKKQYVLSLGLQVFTDAYGGEWGLLMAASTMMVAPVILLFFFAQKHFVTGITMSGLKG